LIQYSYKSPRWNFTALNWDYVFPIPGTNATFHLIQVSSWDMTSASRSNIGAPPPDPVKMVEAINFVSSKLATSTATWKAVFTHYPIWSAGAHGPADLDLVNLLEPILLKNKPDFYLAGHDHCLQHLLVNGLNYYVVGSGSDASNSWTGIPGLPANSLKFSYPDQNVNIGGFAVGTLTETSFQIDFYNDAGTLVYSATQEVQIPVRPPPPNNSSQPSPVSQVPNITIFEDDPSLAVNSGLSDTALYALVLSVVGGLLIIGAGVLIGLMIKERKKKYPKLIEN